MGQEDVIARRYARGLAEHVAESGGMVDVRRDIGVLNGILDPRAAATYVPEFADFLASPSVAVEKKLAAAESILQKAGVGKTASDFLAVLIRHGRVDLLPRVARAFADFAGELTGEFTAVVHTARPLNDDQASRLAKVLSNALGGAVHLHQEVEPGLLAGAKVTVGDRTFDGSVLGKLDRLRNRLMTRGVSELLDAAKVEDAAAAES